MEIGKKYTGWNSNVKAIVNKDDDLISTLRDIRQLKLGENSIGLGGGT